MNHSPTLSGTAAIQADLWGARAADWAEHELQYRSLYADALDLLSLAPGARLLDIGCGSGVCLGVASGRGAQVTGLDASPAMLDHARERAPDAQLDVGDLQFLPYDDGAFDAVTTFNSFWFAADPVAALAEAARVVVPGGRVLMLVFGRPERCDITPMLGAVAALGPPAARGKFDFHERGVLERMAETAGLATERAGSLMSSLTFADEDALLRQLLSPGSVVMAARHSGEAAVRAAILRSLAPYRGANGAYALACEWRYLIASA